LEAGSSGEAGRSGFVTSFPVPVTSDEVIEEDPS